jgi:hypothetical protein
MIANSNPANMTLTITDFDIAHTGLEGRCTSAELSSGNGKHADLVTPMCTLRATFSHRKKQLDCQPAPSYNDERPTCVETLDGQMTGFAL